MISFRETEQCLNVKVKSDINFETTRQMEHVLQDYKIDSNIQEINLDFKEVKFIDSTGVSLLIKWIHPLTQTKTVRIYHASEPIKNVLRICKLDQFVKVV